MLRLDGMREDVNRLRSERAELLSKSGLLKEWEKLKKMAVWGAIATKLAEVETYAMKTCIANGTSDTQWRESAAEARVYRWLRMRPESVQMELEDIASELSLREAEIERLESLTKGA